MEKISIRLALFFFVKKRRILSVLLLSAFALLGFVFSAGRILGTSPDFLNYDNYFDIIRAEKSSLITSGRFEPGFSVLANVLTKLFSTNLIVYGCIVAAALLLKGWVVRALSASQAVFFIVAAFYLVRFFPLHELTQLRAACAVSLMLVGMTLIWRREFTLGALFCTVSMAFHISAAAMIPALFLFTNSRLRLLLIAAAFFVATSFFAGILVNFLADYVAIIQAYQSEGFGDTRPNPFAIQLLIDWAMVIACLLFWRNMTTLMRRVVLLELVGLAIFYGGIELSVIAHRVRELYTTLWVFYVIDGLQHKKTRYLTIAFVSVCMVFYSYVFFVRGTFFD